MGLGNHPQVVYFVKIVSQLVQKEEGGKLALLLGDPLEGTRNLKDLPPLAQSSEWASVERLCQEKGLGPPFHDLLLAHLKTGMLLRQGDFVAAYEVQGSAAQAFLREYAAIGGWANPLLIAIARLLRILATRAEHQAGAGRGQEGDRWEEAGAGAGAGAGASSSSKESLSDAARLLNKAFHVCQTDRTGWESSRKRASLFVVNTLFRIYLRLKQHRLCHTLIRAINNDFPNLNLFPASHRVAFKYFTGLLAFYEENFPVVPLLYFPLPFSFLPFQPSPSLSSGRRSFFLRPEALSSSCRQESKVKLLL